jgi:hypothetical protein
MFANAQGYHPLDLIQNPAACLSATIKKMLQIQAKQHPVTVRDWADAWNSGSCRDAYLPKSYMDHVEAFYNASVMPSPNVA